MQNILILTPGFPKNEQDDTCIPYLQDFVFALAEKIGKENVRVISFHYPFSKGEYVWNDIQIYSAGGKNRKGVFKNLTWRKVKRKAEKWIQPEKTLIHCFWLNETTYVGTKIAKTFGSKIIATIMGQDILPSNTYLTKINWNNLHVVAPNSKAAITFQNINAHEVSMIIRPGIRVKKYEQHERKIDLLFVASFIPLKQPLLFIEIVKHLHTQMPDLHCVMIGNGELIEEAKALIQNYQLPNIKLTGKLKRNAVFEYMQDAKILVHTSHYEGHATVFEEAIMLGMHSVCFDVGRPEHDSIHVCSNLQEMQEMIVSLLRNSIFQPGQQTHSITHTVEQYLHLYA